MNNVRNRQLSAFQITDELEQVYYYYLTVIYLWNGGTPPFKVEQVLKAGHCSTIGGTGPPKSGTGTINIDESHKYKHAISINGTVHHL